MVATQDMFESGFKALKKIAPFCASVSAVLLANVHVRDKMFAACGHKQQPVEIAKRFPLSMREQSLRKRESIDVAHGSKLLKRPAQLTPYVKIFWFANNESQRFAWIN